MADQQAAAEEQPQIQPACPHCRSTPMQVRMSQFLIKPATICAAFYCGNVECGVIVSVQMIGTMRPEKPMIIPGRGILKPPA